MHPEIPWTAIVGRRNLIAHGYAVIDRGRLFETVTRDLPPLLARLDRIVKEQAKQRR